MTLVPDIELANDANIRIVRQTIKEMEDARNHGGLNNEKQLLLDQRYKDLDDLESQLE
jgi:hypothetical protein